MRRLSCLLVILAGALLFSGCAQTANVEQERTALLALDREWSASAKDTEKFLSYFAADATTYMPGMPKVTGQALREHVTAMMSTPGMAFSWTPEKAEVSVAGDIAYTTGTYTATMTNVAGNPVEEQGKYVTVWKKQADQQWKAVEDIFNADAPPAPPSAAHVMVTPSALKWGDMPPSLPSGGKMAVLSGDPSKPEPFTIRAQFPAGYRIAPHWHPTQEDVTVLSGTMALGMGDTFDEAKMSDLPSGSLAALPATMRHYVLAKTATTIQVNGMGPFVVNYVNPADDPSKK